MAAGRFSIQTIKRKPLCLHRIYKLRLPGAMVLPAFPSDCFCGSKCEASSAKATEGDIHQEGVATTMSTRESAAGPPRSDDIHIRDHHLGKWAFKKRLEGVQQGQASLASSSSTLSFSSSPRIMDKVTSSRHELPHSPGRIPHRHHWYPLAGSTSTCRRLPVPNC